MNRRVTALLGSLVGLTVASSAAAAPTLIFSEDWEGNAAQIALRWRGSAVCNQIQNGVGADGALLPTSADATSCSGPIVRDDKGWSGGRMYTNTNAAIFPPTVVANDEFCVTAWIRAAAASDPYIGINFGPTAGGKVDLVNNSAANGEHYLIGGAGGFADGYGGNATAVVKDGTWRRYTKQFKVVAADLTVLGQTTNRFNLKFVNFGGTNVCPVTPPTIGTMDVDDVRIYKLAAGDTCPALGADETPHETCATTKPICNSAAVGTQKVYKCAECGSAFGAGMATSCPVATSPVCIAAGAEKGSCKACAEDLGVTGAVAACGLAANPFCKNDGSCGKCTTDNECKDATKNHGVGANKCDTAKGSCTNGCSVTTEGTDCTNSNKPWCEPVGATAIGICKDKLENGQPIPNRAADTAADKGKCTDANATKFCASASCDKADDKCGFANGTDCVPGTDDAKCRATVCGTDSKCGQVEGGPCVAATDCRDTTNTCTDNKCAPAGTSSSSSSSGGASSSSSSSGASSGTTPPGDGGGGCATTSSTGGSLATVSIGLGLAILALRRRRREGRADEKQD